MFFDNISSQSDFGLIVVIVMVAVYWVAGWLAYCLVKLPMQRAEQARLFLDLLERAVHSGQPLEETLIAISNSRDQSLGLSFHEMAAWLEHGLSFSEALARVPTLLPPAIRAILAASQEIGLRKVLPACRQLLPDAVSRTQSATSYLFMVTLATLPLGWYIQIFILPRFRELETALQAQSNYSNFIFDHLSQWLIAQTFVLAALFLGALAYLGRPQARWLPFLDWVHYLEPWRRKRMQRDFSTLLGLLLDSGAPEPAAIRLAADATANAVFQRRAAQAVARLGEGAKLAEAVAAVDDSGEFAWRLRNAFHGGAHFQRALAGWRAALDAKAYQQEQTAGQIISTAVVLWNGLFVAAIAASVFLLLIAVIDAGVLW